MSCDRCGGSLWSGDEMAQDFLEREYPGKKICESCDRRITLAKSLTEHDTINNAAPGSALRAMLKNYGIGGKND